MTNSQIAQEFRKIAARLELEAENPFRIRAYQRAAKALEGLNEPAHAIARRGGLRKIEGIGKDLEQKIIDLIETGAIRETPEKERFPGRNRAPLILGLDPKMTRLLQKRFRMETREDLERLARSRMLRSVPGLGTELESAILKALENDSPENSAQEGRKGVSLDRKTRL